MSKKTPLDVLREARELISEPDRWARDFAALNSNGEPVPANSPYAVCWCALGAVTKSAESDSTLVNITLPYLRTEIDSVVDFNDSHTHAEVLKLFDDAITLATEKWTFK